VQSVPIATKSCVFLPRSWRDVLDTTLYDKVCQWFSLGTPVSSTNKMNRHDITKILLKVALNTIKKQTNITDFSIFTDFIINELDSIFIFFEIEKKINDNCCVYLVRICCVVVY